MKNKSVSDALANALVAAVDVHAGKKQATKVEDRPLCYFCAAPILEIGDGCIELFCQESGPSFRGGTFVRFNQHGGREEVGFLRYPGTLDDVPHHHGACFSHYSCGRDFTGAYWIGLNRVFDLGGRNKSDDWERHLADKVWGWYIDVPGVFALAREYVAKMPGGKKLKAPWDAARRNEAARRRAG